MRLIEGEIFSPRARRTFFIWSSHVENVALQFESRFIPSSPNTTFIFYSFDAIFS